MKQNTKFLTKEFAVKEHIKKKRVNESNLVSFSKKENKKGLSMQIVNISSKSTKEKLQVEDLNLFKISLNEKLLKNTYNPAPSNKSAIRPT